MFQGKPALPAQGHSSVPAGLFTAVLLLLIAGSRWATAPRYLYYFDSANFALALEHFNPALHQPQPPGYPWFVLFIRLIHVWVQTPERVLLIAGILTAAAATILIRYLAAEVFHASAGPLAAALLASNPVFWFAGVTNQIRLFLALSAIVVAWLAWRALRRPHETRWFYGACAAVGIAAGFRPVESFLLLPLLAWVWWRTGRSLRLLIAGAGLLAAVSVPWIAAIVIASGGLQSTYEMLLGYANFQFRGSSAVFGAPAPSAWFMVKEAVVWNFLGIIGWLWAIPIVLRRPSFSAFRDHITFLSLAFLPAFLFSAVIHIGDPDQALASISILCLLGGGVLAACLRRIHSSVLPVALAVVALQTLVFFVPFNKLSKAASYRKVLAVDHMNRDAIGAIRALRQRRPITIIHYGSSVASRHLEYYFPDDYVVVLPGSPRHRAAGESIMMFYRHSTLDPLQPASGLMLSGSSRLVCLLPDRARPDDLPGWKPLGPAFFMDRESDQPLDIGPYTLFRDGGNAATAASVP